MPDRIRQSNTKPVVRVHRGRRYLSPRARRVAAPIAVGAMALALVLALRCAGTATEDGDTTAQGPEVRIGIVTNATHHRVIAYGAFDILSSAGRAVFTCAGASVVRLSAVDGQPGTYYYYVVAADYPESQKRQARRLLAHLREILKVGMEILPTSERLAQPRSLAGRGDRLMVAVGPFDDLQLAEQWRSYLSRTYKSYIVKDTSKRATGEIHLYDGHDKLLARMKDSVTIRMKDPRLPMTVDRIPGLSKGWASNKPTNPAYRGLLEIRLNDDGRLTAVNVLSMEDYIKGVVPSEIGGTAPFEAQKAQAIAARSEAIHKLGTDRHPGELYDFCDNWHCQTFHGIKDQTASSVRAVGETRGIVLVHGGEVIDAVYCHSCGGVTAHSRDVWKSGDYTYFAAAFDRRYWRSEPKLGTERAAGNWLRSSPDVFCNPNQRGFPDYAKKYFRWTKQYDKVGLERRLNSYADFGQILDLQVLERADSGRVRMLRVVGSKRSLRYTGVDNICRVLGLNSSFFVFTKEHESQAPRPIRSLTIHGGGFGHGVGLCQMGAYMMAIRGYSYNQILGRYYPTTSLGKAY